MRVLHVYTGNLYGGIERMLESLVSVAKKGTDSQHVVALCFEGRLSHALRHAGAGLHLLPPARIKRPLTVVRTRAALRRVLGQGPFDEVICHGIWAYCVFVPAIVGAGYRPILYLHDPPEPGALYYRWASRTLPKVCIVNSQYIARLTEQMWPRVPVEVLHPLVPQPPVLQPGAALGLRLQLQAREDEVVILQASRLEPWKGHRNLLHSLRALRELPGWVCWIAGAPQRPQESEYRLQLLGLIADLELQDRVKFIGHRNDMETVLGACDIYVQANEAPEPFGMVFVEALFAGKPVVGNATGGTLDIITPDCGLLCDSTREGLADALGRLIRDARLRQKMATNGPRRAGELCGTNRFMARFGEILTSRV